MCGARGEEAKQKGAADGAGRERRRRKKEGRPMGRGERGGGEGKRGSRWGGAKGAEANQRGAADGAGRDGRPMGRGLYSGADTKRGGRWGGQNHNLVRGAAPKIRGSGDGVGREVLCRIKHGLESPSLSVSAHSPPLIRLRSSASATSELRLGF
jgi:hypothetical protein